MKGRILSVAVIVAASLAAVPVRGDDCPKGWTTFDCVRNNLADDTLRVLDKTDCPRGWTAAECVQRERTSYYTVANPAYSAVVGTWNAATMRDPDLVDQYLNAYFQIVRRSDAAWYQKRRLLNAAARLRVLAKAAANGQ